MLDISTPELIVVLTVGLLVLGPQKLPEIARAVGKGLRELRKAMHSVTTVIEESTQPEPPAPAPTKPPPPDATARPVPAPPVEPQAPPAAEDPSQTRSQP